MVSPPVGLLNFDALIADPRVSLVITGDQDEIAPAKAIKERVPDWNSEARFLVIPDADHLFSGQTDAIEAAIREFLVTQSP